LRRKRRNSIAKLGMFSLALMMALGMTGVGYCLWTDIASISAEVQTGSWTAQLNVDYLDPASDMYYVLSDRYVDEAPNPDTIEIDIVKPAANGVYSCYFRVTDNGTIPVKVGWTSDSKRSATGFYY
jgi:hypothetical protein